MDNFNREIYIISHAKEYHFITKNSGKFLVLTIFSTLVIAFLSKVDYAYLRKLFILTTVYASIGVIFLNFFKKVAWKMIVDYANNDILFHMCRTNEVRKYSLNSIIKIDKNMYTKFYFKNGKIFCNFGNDKEFIENLNRIKSINGLV